MSTKNIKIALIIGSLRRKSYNRSVANYVVEQFPDNVEVEEVNIEELPHYNEEYDDNDYPEKPLPESYKRIREQINNADLLLICTPEYNRSIPGVLKNAIDVASRPYDNSSLDSKKVAIATASPSSYGGRSSGFDVRKAFLPFAAPVLPKPEVYLSRIHEALDDDGNVVNERTQGFLKKFATAVVDFARHNDGDDGTGEDDGK